MRSRILGSVGVAVATTSLLIGAAAAPAHANSPCEVYDPLFNEYEYFADGTVLEVEGLGTIVCHEGQWVGPAVDSPLPSGGGDVAA